VENIFLPALVSVFINCHVGCMHGNESFCASGKVVFVNFDKVEMWRCVAFKCGTIWHGQPPHQIQAIH
jgi:hypothetical protein